MFARNTEHLCQQKRGRALDTTHTERVSKYEYSSYWLKCCYLSAWGLGRLSPVRISQIQIRVIR